MAWWLEQGIPQLKVAGYTFHLENKSPKYFGSDTIGTENLRENSGKKKLKCCGQLPLGTGSQRHMAEKF